MAEYDLRKDPDAELDYGVSWEDWLEDGESIQTSEWTITRRDGKDVDENNGLKAMSSPAPSNSTTEALVWLEGGVPHTSYHVTNRIVTDAGRTDDRTLVIYAVER